MGISEPAQSIRLETGISVAYSEQGNPSGPPLLLLHAWGESRRCFDRLSPLLAGSHRVFAIDQRGHGQADKPTSGYELASLAADVVAFLDAVDLTSAVLVGSSSGGYVAQQVAISNPGRVDGMVLVGSPRSLHGRAPFADELQRLQDPIEPQWARTFVDWFPLTQDVPGWYLADRVRDALFLPAEVWRRSLAGLTSSPPPTDSGVITAPTLIIWGDQDPLLSRADQQGLAARIRGATLIEYPDVGHLVLWERPDRVAFDTATFVARLSSTESPR